MMPFEELNHISKQCLMLLLLNKPQCVKAHTKLRQGPKYLVAEENLEDKKELGALAKVQLERRNEKEEGLFLAQLQRKII
jgi:hypothetical protein